MANEEANSGTPTGGYYDVFLSFRGPDTRNGFVDCLYEFMVDAGIHVFRDDEALRPGEKISEILRAVKRSQIYIVIFSKDYASSKWCLRELTCMVECTRQSMEKEILPVLYDVDPSDVKLETELYRSALRKHDDQCCEEAWKEALTTVARTKGWHLKDRGHGRVIKEIIQTVRQKLMTTKRDLPTNLVGIDDRIEDIIRLLNCSDTSKVQCVVISGASGVGKTTLAKTVFNELLPQFKHHSFLSNIQDSGIGKIRKILVADLFNYPSRETCDSEDGNHMIRNGLPNMRVLFVLDDLDNNDLSKQLEEYCHLCGLGSRIIVTTRDKRVFSLRHMERFEKIVEIIPYQMEELQHDHAFQLFNKLAFNGDSAPPDLYDLSKEVVELTGGLPLALNVIAPLFRGQEKEWLISTVEKLKRVPHPNVLQRLKISYDVLDYRAKEIYLDIAYFFTNKKKTDPMYMWEACGYYPKVAIEELTSKFLIKIDNNDRIHMHNQLRDLGREIVAKKAIKNPTDRSRSWRLETVHEMRAKNTVAITPRRSGVNFTRKDFSNLKNARFLELNGGNFAGDFENILPELRMLRWRNCPSKIEAKNFVLDRLVVLKLSGDVTTEYWSSWKEIMVASRLKVLHLAGSKSLIKTPCFSELPSLERLILKDFPSLVDIDPSIGTLKGLICLRIKWCPRLVELPAEIGCLTALKQLIVIQCTSLRSLPKSIGNLRLLSRLGMEGAGLVELPDTIKGQASLKYLSLVNCTGLSSLPEAVGELKSLKVLNISGTTMRKLPLSIGKLEGLTFLANSSWIGTTMRTLPLSIGEREGLTFRASSSRIRSQLMWLGTALQDTYSTLGPDGFLVTEDLRQLSITPRRSGNNFALNDLPHLMRDPRGLPSLSVLAAATELRTSTECEQSETAIGELPPFGDNGELQLDENISDKIARSKKKLQIMHICNSLRRLRFKQILPRRSDTHGGKHSPVHGENDTAHF